MRKISGMTIKEDVWDSGHVTCGFLIVNQSEDKFTYTWSVLPLLWKEESMISALTLLGMGKIMTGME